MFTILLFKNISQWYSYKRKERLTFPPAHASQCRHPHTALEISPVPPADFHIIVESCNDMEEPAGGDRHPGRRSMDSHSRECCFPADFGGLLL